MDLEYIEMSQKRIKRPVMCQMFYVFVVLEILLLLPFIMNQLHTEVKPNKWISMSVCLSSVAPHKSSYNYAAAVILSTWLWRTVFDVSVIVTIVYEDDGDLEKVREVQQALLSIKTHVLVTVNRMKTFSNLLFFRRKKKRMKM